MYSPTVARGEPYRYVYKIQRSDIVKPNYDAYKILILFVRSDG